VSRKKSDVVPRAGCLQSRSVEEKQAIGDFHTVFNEDTHKAEVKSVEHYQSLFPGHERAIASEFKVLSAFPETLGHYKLLRELGRGGQGHVFLAEDVRLERKVALKVMAPAWGSQQVDRFEREAAAASRLNHPGICPIYEAGEHEGTHFIAMPYLEGQTLEQLIAEAQESERPTDTTVSITVGPGTAKQIDGILRVIERVALALHAAHEAGLVHRDVKPANILVRPDGRPIVLDFGLARDTTGGMKALTVEGDLMGTPAYMSPEQLLAQRITLDQRTDIYSLGVTLYECLTLRRPFDATSREALYKQILTAEPPNPMRFNKQIGQDLQVVCETAMEKDRDRRYQTAKDLAEDLRRVRSFESIKAKPAGIIRRAAKWTQRHPGKAVGIAAAILALLTVVGVIVGQRIARDRAVSAHLATAEKRLAGSDLDGAAEAAARAHERDPGSGGAVAIKERIRTARRQQERDQDLAEAGRAREKAVAKQKDHTELKDKVGALSKRVAEERDACFAKYADEAQRAAFARLENELDAETVRLELLLQDAREDLERARRLEGKWGATSPDTHRAFAEFYVERWREARKGESAALEQAYRAAVRRHDLKQRHEKTLLGRGILAVTVMPPDAEVYLFRYESYETVRTDKPVVPRLVPVPTTGVGRTGEEAWAKTLFPGDQCYLIEGVEEGSAADAAGLKPGDFVLSVNGVQCDLGAMVFRVAEGSHAEKAGIKPWSRLERANGRLVDHYTVANVWRSAVRRGEPVTAVIDGKKVAPPVGEKMGIVHAPLIAAVQAKVGIAGVNLQCLHNGEPVTFEVPKDQASGLRGRVTAYPLFASAHNRIRTARQLEADPGSYLVLARKQGYEDQRFHVRVQRDGEIQANLLLQKEGTTPEGFVYVPPGPFVFGGDEKAFRPWPREELDLEGFFIQATPVNFTQWLAFLNDPATLKEIEASETVIYLPREKDREGTLQLLVEKTKEGKYQSRLAHPTTAVLGITLQDAEAYLKWRNQQAEKDGERWTYDLPKEEQWEKAARGADERLYPWGDRADCALSVGLLRAPAVLAWAPAGYEPRDASPYGVLDMAGSRWEYARPRGQGKLVNRGGAWNRGADAARIGSRGFVSREGLSIDAGFRLVAKPRER